MWGLVAAIVAGEHNVLSRKRAIVREIEEVANVGVQHSVALLDRQTAGRSVRLGTDPRRHRAFCNVLAGVAKNLLYGLRISVRPGQCCSRLGKLSR